MFDMKKFKTTLLTLVGEAVQTDDLGKAQEVIQSGFGQIEKDVKLAMESAVNEQVKAGVEAGNAERDAKLEAGLKTLGERVQLYGESAVKDFVKANEEQLTVESQNRVGKSLFEGIGKLVGESAFAATADGSARIEELNGEVGTWKDKANEAESRALTAESKLKDAEHAVAVREVGRDLPTAERLTFESRVDGMTNLTKDELVAIRDSEFLTSTVTVGESDESASAQIEAENAESVVTGESEEETSEDAPEETPEPEELATESKDEDPAEVARKEKFRKLMGWK